MQHYLILLTSFLMGGVFSFYSDEAMSSSGTHAGVYINLRTDFGTTFNAYAVGDQTAENGVLLVHDKWGLDQQVIQWADHFAELGYRVLAVDLYDGRQVSNAEMADEVFRQIDPVWIEADLKGAVKYLKQSQRKIVSMGWGMGGEHALSLALQEPQDISAVVTYCSVPITDDQLLDSLNGPMLAIFASRDNHIDRKTIKAFNDLMGVLGKELVEVRVDADCGFANPRTKAYNEDVANQAWDATREFLAKHLAVSSKSAN